MAISTVDVLKLNPPYLHKQKQACRGCQLPQAEASLLGWVSKPRGSTAATVWSHASPHQLGWLVQLHAHKCCTACTLLPLT